MTAPRRGIPPAARPLSVASTSATTSGSAAVNSRHRAHRFTATAPSSAQSLSFCQTAQPLVRPCCADLATAADAPNPGELAQQAGAHQRERQIRRPSRVSNRRPQTPVRLRQVQPRPAPVPRKTSVSIASTIGAAGARSPAVAVPRQSQQHACRGAGHIQPGSRSSDIRAALIPGQQRSCRNLSTSTGDSSQRPRHHRIARVRGQRVIGWVRCTTRL
jgi:hypothetical protein